MLKKFWSLNLIIGLMVLLPIGSKAADDTERSDVYRAGRLLITDLDKDVTYYPTDPIAENDQK